MGKRQKKEKEPKRVVIRSKRSDKVIIDQFTRKFRRIIQSQGTCAARDWLALGPTRTIGGGKSAGRTIVLPMAKLKAILAAS